MSRLRWLMTRVRRSRSNRYMLLIGDQKEATQHMQELRKNAEKISNTFSYGNYYGLFPQIDGSSKQGWESQVQIPRAEGFGTQKE